MTYEEAVRVAREYEKAVRKYGPRVQAAHDVLALFEEVDRPGRPFDANDHEARLEEHLDLDAPPGWP